MSLLRRRRHNRDPEIRLVSEPSTPWHTTAPAVMDQLRHLVSRAYVQDKYGLASPLGVVALDTGHGASYVARSLAHVLALDLEQRVCLVDLNWHHPAAYPGHARKGLAEVLRGEQPLPGALEPTSAPSLHLLRAGRADEAERAAFAHSSALTELLEELAERFGHLVLDLPPLHHGETLTLASRAEACMLVVGQDRAELDEVQRALDELAYVGCLGVVMNQTRSRLPKVLANRLVP
jgi:Mrp family chromosome partitioning ATPase